MANIDLFLVREATKFITGANVHLVRTWLYWYEASEPGSKLRGRYENLLRDFVSSSRRLLAAQIRVELNGARLRAIDKRGRF